MIIQLFSLSEVPLHVNAPDMSCWAGQVVDRPQQFDGGVVAISNFGEHA